MPWIMAMGAWPLAQDRRANRGSDALADAEEEEVT
jgi:hypothetical protein